MSDSHNRLREGGVVFVFTAEWENGTVKQDVVEVDIIGFVLDEFDFYRSN
ncbi:hypothetical protein ACTWQB_16220 [Piscibacillus sp. B03]